jgi:hypothetical protein
MWMYFSDSLIGDPERGTFLDLRESDEEEDLIDLVHVNLLTANEELVMPLMSGDIEVGVTALEEIADDLDADDGLLQLLDEPVPLSESGVEVSLEEGWLLLDHSHLFNVNNSAVIGVEDGEGSAVGVVYVTRAGGILLFSGTRTEAREYLFVLAHHFGASSAIASTVEDYLAGSNSGRPAHERGQA